MLVSVLEVVPHHFDLSRIKFDLATGTFRDRGRELFCTYPIIAILVNLVEHRSNVYLELIKLCCQRLDDVLDLDLESLLFDVC